MNDTKQNEWNDGQAVSKDEATEVTRPACVELADDELDRVAGGLIGLLLPAVQKVRE